MPVFDGKDFFIIPNDNFCFLSDCCLSCFSSSSITKNTIFTYFNNLNILITKIPLIEFSISVDRRFDMV